MNNSVAPYFTRKMVERNVLNIGEFVMNSGLKSIFYYDFSHFNDSKGLIALGFAYTKTIKDLNLQFDILFGTAYKGIIPCLATSMYFFQHCDPVSRNVPWAFDRKEEKVHGEGGNVIGTDLKGKRILILDDVLTSGKAITRAINTVKSHDPASIEILVGVNRSDLKVIEGLTIHSIVTHEYVLSKIDHIMNK